MTSKYRTLIDSMRAANAPDKLIVDTIRNMEPATKAATKKPTGYTEEFEKFWQAYPDTKGQSKIKTAAAWEKLWEEDQAAAFRSIVPYKAHLKKTEYACKHALTFINGRTWESLETPSLVAVELQVVKLTCTGSSAHSFLAECRKDGADEGDIRYWSKGRFSIESVKGLGGLYCVVAGEMGDFDAAFKKTLNRLNYKLWNRRTYERNLV